MANIALTTLATADNNISIVESFEQMDLPAEETVVAGAPIRVDGTTGNYRNGNATTATEADCYGLAFNGATLARLTITGLRHGVVDGFDLSGMSYWDPVYLSDTDGRLATTPGTVQRQIGQVIPAEGIPLGTAADKLLLLNFNAGAFAASVNAQYFYTTYTALLLADQVDMQHFITDRAVKLVGASFLCKTPESAGTLNIQLTRCQGVEAAASGDVLLSNNTSAGFNGVCVAQTLETGVVITTAAVNEFAAGNRLGIDFTGDVAGELVGTTITCKWQFI